MQACAIQGSDVLFCVLKVVRVDKKRVFELQGLRTVSKFFRSVVDGINMNWDSRFLQAMHTPSSMAIASVRKHAVLVLTLPEMTRCMLMVRRLVETFFRGIQRIKKERGVIYSDFATQYTQCMRRIIFQLDQSLDETCIMHIIDSNVLDPVIYDENCEYQYSWDMFHLIDDADVWFMHLRFLVYEHGELAKSLFERFNVQLQMVLLSDKTPVGYVEEVLLLEQRVGAKVFYNHNDSQINWVFQQTSISDLLISKLRMVLSVYGRDFMGFVPRNDVYCRNTMVTGFLLHGYTSEAGHMQDNALSFLVNVYPEALGIVSTAGAQGMSAESYTANNSFSWVAYNCVDAAKHGLVAQMVMEHATMEDMRRVQRHWGVDMTLMEIVVGQRNRYVAQIVLHIFDQQLTCMEQEFLRTLE